MGENPSYFKDCGSDCPVEQVSWWSAIDFINALNELGEGHYALPTEEEWIFAASPDLYKMETESGEPISLDSVAWHQTNSGDKTHPVGQKSPNAYGLYDMIGNVAEYIDDWAGWGSSCCDLMCTPCISVLGGDYSFNDGSLEQGGEKFPTHIEYRQTGFRVLLIIDDEIQQR